MPNRILRDWTDSENINTLSIQAERFFCRLIMKADDFGRYTGNIRLLKSNLFPLLTDSIRDADISRWMAECQKAGVIVIYEVLSKPYLEILNFNQRLRQKIAKYPPPHDGHVSDNCMSNDSTLPLEEKRSRREVETEEEVEVNGVITPQNNLSKKSKKIDHLFSDSDFYDLETFEKQFENTDYQFCDLKIYHEKIKNWSASGGKKKIDWIATARNFMLSDKENGKLILKNGTKQFDKNSKSESLRRSSEEAGEQSATILAQFDQERDFSNRGRGAAKN